MDGDGDATGTCDCSSFVMKINKPKQTPFFFQPLTTTMSSPSQIDYTTMREDRLAEMLSKVKSSRETEALRARLPAQLAQFASNNQHRGAHPNHSHLPH